MLKALLTDIDGTITDPTRRVHTGAVELIRSLVGDGVEVVLASGNTSCFMDSLCRVIGTRGSFIAENGGVFRVGFDGELHLKGNQEPCRKALGVLEAHYEKQGIRLTPLSLSYRFTDLAIARTVPAGEIRALLTGYPVEVIDTGYAIHLQEPGITKGTALGPLAAGMGLTPSDFIAIGDSVNDIQMLNAAGIGLAVANAHADTKAAAQYVAEKKYGDGFVEAVKKYYPYFRAR